MRDLLECYAEIIDYPRPNLLDKVRRCVDGLRTVHQESATLMQEFQRFVEQNAQGNVEELYTSTFEMQGNCCLYAGHYIFGEDFRRSLLMVKLKEYYRDTGFSAGKELPDHLAVMLNFIAGAGDRPECGDLLADCMIPALTAMLGKFTSKNHPYKWVLQSLLMILQEHQKRFPARPSSKPGSEAQERLRKSDR